MNIALSWWTPTNGGSQQAIRGNYMGLEKLGHDVDIYWHTILDRLEASIDQYDLVILPYAFYSRDARILKEADAHVHLQLGGWGANDFNRLARMADVADTISTLDPQLYRAFSERAPSLTEQDVRVIPNPPNFELFDKTPTGDVYFTPKVGDKHKEGQWLRQIAEEHDDKMFVANATGDVNSRLPDNVEIRPPVPFTWMPEIYREARAVVNPAQREGLPNTCFEAFLTATPYVAVEEDGIGDIQTLPEPPVDDFGLTVSEFMDKHAEDVGTGDHYARTVDEATPDVGDAGREWAESWLIEQWSWKEKMEQIVELAR